MKRYHHRSVSILLLAAMLAALPAAASCGDTSDGQTTDTTAASAGETTAAPTDEARIEPTLPDKKWDGYKFRVLTKGTDNVHWKSKEIVAEEENGDVINDAVYRRNLAVTERFGVTFSEIVSPNGTWDLTTPLRTAVLAGADDYDMVAGSLSDVVRKVSAEGMLVDLRTVPYIDLEKPWYDANSVEQTQLCDRVFAVSSDMFVMDEDATIVTLFNKQIAGDYKLEDIYSLVRSGKWTIDKMTEMAAAVAKDLDSDGKMGYDDQFGLCSEPLNVYFSMVGCGVQAAKRTGDEVELDVKNEKFVDAFLKAVKLNKDYDYCLYANNVTGVTDAYADVIDPAFVENRILFNYAGLVRVSHFRSMETDFGIVPVPKFDAAQKEYFTPISIGCGAFVMIPVTAPDLERTGAIIEMLSAESHYGLREAYYENAIRSKGARDEESKEMLDIIFANRVYDLAHIHNWGGLIDAICALEIDGNISSTIEAGYTAAETAMKKTIEDYRSLS